ncbi:hypothetical protein DLJ53_25785 [Acuticoccus sediminis]|uniref:Uncharacterized protein n=1 Tax=Acuticoccus sediminis TaxID=2184697 RepID=A0A8B2NQ31_9HYPH|nr:hypothetical protein [Acuticoccus sediminis]RAH98135.1 hypothetical protein DLJ53_25785 [Acuticoccus sediminis]
MATLVPVPLPGLLQPLADPLTPVQTVLAACGATFSVLVSLFALAALVRPDRTFGVLIIAAAIGASFCLGPVVAALMSGAVLASLPLVLTSGDDLAMRPRPGVAATKPRRPRRLFA